MASGCEFLKFTFGSTVVEITGDHKAVSFGGFVASDKLIHAAGTGQTLAKILAADLHSFAAGRAFLNKISGRCHG